MNQKDVKMMNKHCNITPKYTKRGVIFIDIALHFITYLPPNLILWVPMGSTLVRFGSILIEPEPEFPYF